MSDSEPEEVLSSEEEYEVVMEEDSDPSPSQKRSTRQKSLPSKLKDTDLKGYKEEILCDRSSKTLL